MAEYQQEVNGLSEYKRKRSLINKLEYPRQAKKLDYYKGIRREKTLSVHRKNKKYK
jgi:hypothetical protein